MKRHLVLLAALSFSFHALADIAVIVHPSNDAALSVQEIKRIFLGKLKSYPSGRTILAANLTDLAISKEFNESVLKKSSSQIKAYWSRIMFTGKGMPPVEIDSIKAMLETVSNNPDAIGYVEAKSATSVVKVLAIF